MTTTAPTSVTSTPSTSSANDASPASSKANTSALPPLTTTTPTARRSTLSRPMSHVSRNRLSQFSTGSVPSKSRPESNAFPLFPSTLSYTLVRDFAYPYTNPLHYGPPPEPSGPPSGWTTPASESRRLSDPPVAWDHRLSSQFWGSDRFSRAHDIPPIHCSDGGPPYSEDEDLQSPVVATRHRKHKSTASASGARRSQILNPSNYDSERGYYVGTSGDGHEKYYVNQGGEANGPGGEFVTYPPDQSRHSRAYHYDQTGRPRDEYDVSENASSPASSGFHDADQSRYSRDYQFTITSPDEEFHGKAVALFDFARENENELPLVEGQIIWVSYRHGQGWLVAEDPKTQESGLVPEEYVRLLRDIEGGMNSLTGNLNDSMGSGNDASTPTQAEHFSHSQPTGTGGGSGGTNGYHQPVVSMFSTSSKDLNPYPTEQLGIHAGQAPPQVVHYHGQRGGSQTSTPTINQSQDTPTLPKENDDGLSKEDRRSSRQAARNSKTVAAPRDEERIRSQHR
ncbi:RING finger domain-containing protein [Cordyceps fumosorosea ARSEF 2679]|uniref:RING finger domain-containing protein n=1 Tax=Cordyceps fumosorosea (strain ARSEF 2679) TaxID=1081104 RepID=A0A167S7R7_CORFA|nr:RING finger domain-containing protein [Cordyceps fumosorosea ARSEF 2679]OAA59345.1 RING finger domain-containing protein [Cordyceps fumosorosea ARSEF 2679]